MTDDIVESVTSNMVLSGEEEESLDEDNSARNINVDVPNVKR